MHTRTKKKIFIGFFIFLALVVGVIVAVYLALRSQDVRQRADEPSPFGQSAALSGQEYARSPANSKLTGPFTIEGWIKPDLPTTATQGAVMTVFNTSPEEVEEACSDTLGLQIVSESENGSFTHNTVLTIDQSSASESARITGGGLTGNSEGWTHLAITHDSSGMVRLYVNGAQQGNHINLDGLFCAHAEFAVGAAYPPEDGGSIQPTDYFRGEIDEVRISKSVRYASTFTPQLTPFTEDEDTHVLLHLDGDLIDEVSGQSAVAVGSISFVPSSLGSSTPTATPTSVPACIPDQGSCEWDPVGDATSYNYKITETDTGTVVREGSVQAPETKVVFTIKPNTSYTCAVTASNTCGIGPEGKAMHSCVVVTPSATPTGVPTPTGQPTSTPEPTVTPIPTSTPVSPTPTNPSPIVQRTTQTVIQQRDTQTIVQERNNTIVQRQQSQTVVQTTPVPTLPPTGPAEVALSIGAAAVISIIGAVIFFLL